MSETPNDDPVASPATAPSTAPGTRRTPEPHDPAQEIVDTVRRRWALALGVIGWLMTVIGPAISFNAKLALSSNAGTEFQAFFLVMTTAMFLLTWRSLDRLPPWSLGVAAVLALLSFVTYSQAKEKWTCLSYLDPSPLVMGTVLKPNPAAYLAKQDPPPATCEAIMENWGGDAYQIWEEKGVRIRFLTLFGLYALAWLSLALLVLGTARRSLAQWNRTG